MTTQSLNLSSIKLSIRTKFFSRKAIVFAPFVGIGGLGNLCTQVSLKFTLSTIVYDVEDETRKDWPPLFFDQY